MSRPGVSYFDVAKAAQKLVGNGQSPTIELIRALLGTGSNGTIATHLRAWRTQQDPTQQLALQADLPEELVLLMKGLWDRITREANGKIEEIQQEVRNEITVLNQNNQKLQQENNQFQQKHQQNKQEKDGLVQEKSALEQIIVTYKSEIIGLQAKQDGVTQQLQEKQDRIEDLNHQNRQIQANLEHYRTASAEQRQIDQQRFEQRQTEFERTVQALQYDLMQSQEEKAKLKQAKEQLCFENGILESKVDKIAAHNEAIIVKLNEAQEALSQEKSAHQHWKAQYAGIYAKWEEQYKRNIDLQVEQAVLVNQVDSMKAELKEITSQNSVLVHEKWILGQEKAQLFGQLKQIESSL